MEQLSLNFEAVESDCLDPYEGATRPEGPFPSFMPVNRYYIRRRRFQWALMATDGAATTKGVIQTDRLSLGAARAFLEERITWMRCLHQRARQSGFKECWFDPLPIDPRTGKQPGER